MLGFAERKGFAGRRLCALAACALHSCLPAQAHAQKAAPAGAEDDRAQEDDVVVRGQRGSAIANVAPLATYDGKFIEGTGASSMGELLQLLLPMARSADGADPIILLNGQRTSGWEEIQSLPPEALSGTELLPESAAIRYGYPPTRRLLNFMTKPRFRSIELSGYAGGSTAGGVATRGGMTGLTRIASKRRLTLAAEYAHADPLRTSGRPFTLDPDNLFDPVGNVVAAGGGALDPVLSAAAGRPVTATAIPGDPASRGVLSVYLPTAGRLNVYDGRPFSTLADRSDTVKGNAVLKTPLAGGIDSNFTLSGERNWKQTLSGYPTLAVFLPAGNPWSPFARDVLLDRVVPDRLMKTRTGTTTLHGGAVVQGGLRGWQWDITGSVDEVRNTAHGDRGYGVLAINQAVAAGANPFGDLTSALVGPRLSQQLSVVNRKAETKAVLRGTALRLPAGDLSVIATAEGGWVQAHSRSHGFVESDFRVHQSRAEAGLTVDIPIASRLENVLPFLGDLSVKFSERVRTVEDYRTLHDNVAGLNWTPLKGLQLTATRTSTQSAPNIDYRSAVTVENPNTPYFDFGTGRNVYVTFITGGNPDLAPERRRVTSYGFTFKPFDKTQFTISGTYSRTLVRDGSIVVPALTPGIEAELPEQFVRDAAGRLTTVSIRPFNFYRQRQQSLTFQLNFWSQLGKQQPAGQGKPPKDRAIFYAGAAPNFFLSDRLELRRGFPAHDLLAGDTTDGSRYHYRTAIWTWAGINQGGRGVNLTAQYLGAADIKGGVPQSDLHFAPRFSLDARFHVWLPKTWTRKTRLTLEVTNLFDSYEHVHDGNGATPFRYQRYLLDPVGRTFKLTLRKLFQ